MCPSQPTRPLVEGPGSSGLNVEPGRSSQVESLETRKEVVICTLGGGYENHSYFGSPYLTFKLPSDPR